MKLTLAVITLVIAAGSGGDRPDAALESLSERAAAITELRANFRQLKHTVLLREPLESSGTIRVKGGTVRWDTTKPRRSVMVVTEREIQIYYPDHATLEVYEAVGKLGQLAASPLPRLAALREIFTIEQSPLAATEASEGGHRLLALLLTPIDPALQQHLERVRIVIDEETAIVSRLEMTHPDGERLVLIFEDVETNPGLRDEDLALRVPPGTRVVRPRTAGN